MERMNAPVREFQLAIQWCPGELRSFWDMLKVSAANYIKLGGAIEATRLGLLIVESEKEFDAKVKMEDGLKEETLRNLKKMHDVCVELDLPISIDVLGQHLSLDTIPRTRGEFEILIETTMAELKTKLFLFVPRTVSMYYGLILPSMLSVAFPSANKELIAAGNAIAAGLPTASVFHSMRAAEIGVRALGAALGVSFPNHSIELAEWQAILEQTQSKINSMKALPRSTQKDDELQFYSEAAVQFWYFKDAWRIRVAHARASYDEAEAVKIFDHAFSFFQTLSTRLKEPS
jgi:hypothetical protein